MALFLWRFSMCVCVWAMTDLKIMLFKCPFDERNIQKTTKKQQQQQQHQHHMHSTVLRARNHHLGHSHNMLDGVQSLSLAISFNYVFFFRSSNVGWRVLVAKLHHSGRFFQSSYIDNDSSTYDICKAKAIFRTWKFIRHQDKIFAIHFMLFFSVR